MKKFFAIFFDVSFLKFLLIGGCNFILSMAIMFLLYNFLNLGYWGSSMISFTLCSVISYILNRKYSFKSTAPLIKSAVKFSIVIAISYVVAFGAAKPIMLWLMQITKINLQEKIIEQLAMILAQGIFTIINFIGQRLWAFK